MLILVLDGACLVSYAQTPLALTLAHSVIIQSQMSSAERVACRSANATIF